MSRFMMPGDMIPSKVPPRMPPVRKPKNRDQVDLSWKETDLLLFYPGQPRYPAGHPMGGQWKSSGGDGVGAKTIGDYRKPMSVEGRGALNELDPVDGHGRINDLDDPASIAAGNEILNRDRLRTSAGTPEAIEERAAYEYWKDPQGYKVINQVERNPDMNDIELVEHIDYHSVDQFVVSRARIARNTMAESLENADPIPEDMTLFRAVSGEYISDYGVGDTIKPAGFTSLTTENRHAGYFLDKYADSGPVMLRVKAFGGDSRLVSPDLAGVYSESEFMPPLGSSFRITNISRGYYDPGNPIGNLVYAPVVDVELVMP